MHLVLPKALQRISERSGSLDAVPDRDDEGMWERCPQVAELVCAGLKNSTHILCNALSSHLDVSPAEAYRLQSRRHAYAGTVFLSLSVIARQNLAVQKLDEVHKAIYALRRKEPTAWKLFRQAVRSSVAEDVFPIFAVYDAEVKSGKPLYPLTERQRETLGLS